LAIVSASACLVVPVNDLLQLVNRISIRHTDIWINARVHVVLLHAILMLIVLRVLDYPEILHQAL